MGLEYARQLADRGYDLILVSNRQEELDTAAEALRAQFPVHIIPRFQDLAVPDAADTLFEWCREEGVLPDIVINNAGIFFFKELQTADLERVQAMVNLHVVTETRMCLLFGNSHAALPPERRKDAPGRTGRPYQNPAMAGETGLTRDVPPPSGCQSRFDERLAPPAHRTAASTAGCLYLEKD